MKKVQLTQLQAEEVLYLIKSSLEQHVKVFNHDDWDEELSKTEKYERKWFNRRLESAIKFMRFNIAKSKE